MRKRLTAGTALALLVTFVWLSVGVVPAYAAVTDPPAWGASGSPFDASGNLLPDAWAQLQSPGWYAPVTKADAAAGVTQGQVNSVLDQARANGGVLPSVWDITHGTLSSDGSTTVGAGTAISGGSVVLKSGFWVAMVAQALPGYFELYHLLHGDYGTTAPVYSSTLNTTFSPAKWDAVAPGDSRNMPAGTACGGTSPATGCFKTATKVMVLEYSACTGSACTPSPVASCVSMTPPFDPSNPGWVGLMNSIGSARLRALVTPALSTGWGTSPDTNCFYATVGKSDWESLTTRTPSDAATFNTFGDRVTNYFTQAPDATGAKTAFGTHGSQTDAQKGAEKALGAAVAPAGAPAVSPFRLPVPEDGETDVEYRARLRALGYLGSVTFLDDPGYDPAGALPYPVGSPALQLAPGVVTKVAVGLITNPSAVEIYNSGTGVKNSIDPANMPTVDPATTTNVAVQRVPATYAPPAGSPPSTGTLDFTPLTRLNPGCVFPFGIFCYAKDVTDEFNVAPTAPDFSLALPAVDAAGHHYASPGNWDVNLSRWDDYMATLRDIESAVLWIGAAYWLGSRLFGFDAGDPGEALGHVHGHWLE